MHLKKKLVTKEKMYSPHQKEYIMLRIFINKTNTTTTKYTYNEMNKTLVISINVIKQTFMIHNGYDSM